MAASENQGLQITLIVFIILTVLLAVTTFVYFRQSGEQDQRLQAQAAELQNAQNGIRKSEEDLARMREIVGLGPDAEGAAGTAGLQATEDAFKADMDKFAATLPEEKRRYRDALEALFDELNTVNQRLKEELARTQDLMDKHQQREGAKDAQIQEHIKAVEAAKAELATERAKFADELARITASNEELKTSLSGRQTELDTAREQLTGQKKDFDRQIARYEAQLDGLRRQVLELTKTTFEAADGQVVRVDLTKRTVWISLGTNDYVRPLIAFSVYGTDQNDVARNAPKGRIEVTRVLGPKLSEARILEDVLTNPIASGDLVATSLWAPGRQEHFALAGFLDVNGDGESDREAIRDMIALAGGVVDAEVDDNGKRTGELTLNTRYLVRGSEPTGDAFKPFSEILIDANQFGVEIITLDKFLDHIGWSDPRRVIDYSSQRGEDFSLPRRGTPPISAGNTTELFRKRTPPRPRSGSAY